MGGTDPLGPMKPRFARPPNSQIMREFDQIDRYQDHLIAKGKRSINIGLMNSRNHLNRYREILPYDYNRVILRETNHDYINASSVSLGSQCFIAAQGPLRNTVGDFWKMISQIESEEVVVLMLTPLQEMRYNRPFEKCYKYWKKGLKLENQLKLKRLSRKENYQGIVGLKYSIFTLTSGENTINKTVHHLYFSEWKDYDKPNDLQTLITLNSIVHDLNRHRTETPIVTHCSAGVGRTGTFIAMDFIIKNLGQFEEGKITLFQLVQRLREQRPFLVQALEQYCFLYDSLSGLLNH